MIGATIMNDLSTCYWAMALVRKNDHPLRNQINKMHTISLIASLGASCALIISAVKLWHWLPLTIFLFLTVAAAIIEFKKRLTLKEASLSVITKLYHREKLEQYTLYALSEELSIKFYIPSLVDLVTKSNDHAKSGLIIIFLFIPVLIPIEIPFLTLMALAFLFIAAIKIFSLEYHISRKVKYQHQQC